MDSNKALSLDAAAICRRLEVMISLLLGMGSSGATTVTDKILRLSEMGLTDSEVAAIVNRKLNYITSIKSQAKGRKKTKEA